MHALPHLSAIDWISLGIFFASWSGYAWYSEHSRWGASGLIRTGHGYRLQWAYRMLERHDWRKVAPDTRHPKSDPAIQEAWKKNSRKFWVNSSRLKQPKAAS